MKKLFMFVVLAAMLTACPGPNPGGGGVNPPNTTTTVPQAPQEPESHQKPFVLDDDGLKVGGVRTIGEQYIIQGHSMNFSPKPPASPACPSQPVLGSLCQQGSQPCDFGDTKYSCEKKLTHDVFGWIYLKEGSKYTPLKDIPVEIFWFAGCIAGICNPMAGPVLSNEWGYVSIKTSWLLDTFAIKSPPGYYGVCDRGTPRAGGGSYIPQGPPAAFGHVAFKQMKITESSCKGNPVGTLSAKSEEAEPQVEDGVPFFKDDKTVCQYVKGKETCKSLGK